MAIASTWFNVIFIFLSIQSFECLVLKGDPSVEASRVITDLKEVIVKRLGFQADDFNISSFDVRDTLVGRSMAYEFDIEIGDKIIPFKLVEEANRWEFIDLPVFRIQNSSNLGDQGGLAKKSKSERVVSPVLSPFQLSGPVEIWIQDGEDMRISIPNDVDAGVLRKIVLAEGAVINVKGARSVSIRRPLELPLSLNRTQKGFASRILALADHIRWASLSPHQPPLLSLRITGATSLTSSSSSSSTPSRLKLKRLAPGFIELSPLAKSIITELVESTEVSTLLRSDQFGDVITMWPFALNGTNINLQGFEKLLQSVLNGVNVENQKTFRLLKAEVSAQTFVKMGFGLEKSLHEEVMLDGFPAWRTRPDRLKLHFEVLAKLDGDRMVPERVMQVEPVVVEDTVSPNVVMGNVTLSTLPLVYPPPDPFLL